MTAVRDDTATTACPVCATRFEPEGRQRFCSTGCRQTAWRRGRSAPVEPVVARSDTVDECPHCETRYLGFHDAAKATSAGPIATNASPRSIAVPLTTPSPSPTITGT